MSESIFVTYTGVQGPNGSGMRNHKILNYADSSGRLFSIDGGPQITEGQVGLTAKILSILEDGLFIGHGFDRNGSEIFASALVDHSRLPAKSILSPYGTRFVCDGPMRTPNGTPPRVRTVWQKENEGTCASFITAYPL